MEPKAVLAAKPSPTEPRRIFADALLLAITAPQSRADAYTDFPQKGPLP